MDDRWVAYSKQKALEGKCEIGMHLHAWNTPPEYTLENHFGGNPYITEYPAEIMDQKVETMMTLLQQRYEMPVISHRSGRWATNADYFDALARHGIRVDCSVTPELDLSKISGCSQNCGNDYRKAPKGIYKIHPEILEVPMTTRRIRHATTGSVKHRLKTLLKGDDLWLRPIRQNVESMIKLTQRVIQDDNGEYLEFMIHSSELMPGGSPYCKTEEAVEKLYRTMDQYFSYVTDLGYMGTTLQAFFEEKAV